MRGRQWLTQFPLPCCHPSPSERFLVQCLPPPPPSLPLCPCRPHCESALSLSLSRGGTPFRLPRQTTGVSCFKTLPAKKAEPREGNERREQSWSGKERERERERGREPEERQSITPPPLPPLPLHWNTRQRGRPGWRQQPATPKWSRQGDGGMRRGREGEGPVYTPVL